MAGVKNESAVDSVPGGATVEEHGQPEGDNIAKDEEGAHHDGVVLEGAEERRRGHASLQLTSPLKAKWLIPFQLLRLSGSAPIVGTMKTTPKSNNAGKRKRAAGNLSVAPRGR